MNASPTLSIVCPCYNEENVVEIFLQTVVPILEKVTDTYEIIFINDGSTDNTFNVLLEAKQKYLHLRVLNLSRNFGKEAALTAGLENAYGEAIIPIDVDLQDPPELIVSFMEKWREGYDVVLAERADRSSDSLAKKLSAQFFYRIHNKISDIFIPQNVGDYRLMSKRVVNTLKTLPENQRYMKGLFAWAGYKTTKIPYKRHVRAAGETHFSGWKLWNFALDGITGFSTVPLRVWMYLGLLFSSIAFFYGGFIILKTIILGKDLPGYASLLTTVLFLGGIQLMGIGVLGEYIGRIYKEAKRRPTYVVENEY